MGTFHYMTQVRGTLEFVMMAPALLAMLVSPSMRQASADAPGGHVRVLHETPVSPSAAIPRAIRDACRALGKAMPGAIARASRHVTLVETPKQLTDKVGRYLFVEITEVRARGRGGTTSGKHLVVRGSLVDNGHEIADFDGDRGSMGPTGTCAGLDKAEQALGTEIGRWLEHPKPHARLEQ